MTHIQAMLCALGAFFCWVLYDVNSKLAVQADVSPFVIMAIFGIVGVCTILGIAFFKRDFALLYSRNPRSQAAICLFFIVSSYLNVLALRHVPLTVFYLVYFAAPLVIASISALLKHERLTFSKTACLLIGFLGVGIVLLPSLTGGGEIIGYIAVLTSVAAFSARAIILRKIAQINTMESLLFFSSLAIGSAGVVGCVMQDNPMPDNGRILLTFVACCLGLLGHFLYNTASRHTPATNIAQIHYTQLIWGAIFGYLIWHDVLTVNLAIGSLLIIGAGIFAARQAQKNQELETIPITLSTKSNA